MILTSLESGLIMVNFMLIYVIIQGHITNHRNQEKLRL